MVLQVGGGFTGFTFVTISLSQHKGGAPHTLILSLFIALVFAFGIAAGLALIEKPRLGVPLSGFYQMLQILHISSLPFTYSFFSGVEVVVGWWKAKPIVMLEHGGRFSVQLFVPGQSWGIGINVIALILFLYLACARSPVERFEQNVVSVLPDPPSN